MKRFFVVSLLATSLLVLFGFTDQSASPLSEKTVIFRVRPVDAKKPVKFSGMYKSDTGEEIPFNGSSFGVLLKTNSLNGYVKKESGDGKVFVEVIEFNGKTEVGSYSNDGDQTTFETWRRGGVDGGSIRQGLP